MYKKEYVYHCCPNCYAEGRVVLFVMPWDNAHNIPLVVVGEHFCSWKTIEEAIKETESLSREVIQGFEEAFAVTIYTPEKAYEGKIKLYAGCGELAEPAEKLKELEEKIINFLIQRRI